MTVAIEDYALIGDCRSAALVSRAGSIDWLCWPRFESPAIFASLLDPACGSWAIEPRGLPPVRRRYVGDSAVLETTFADRDAEVILVDAMPIATANDARTRLTPEHELLRVVRCTRGSTEIDVRLVPRPGFGAGRLVVRDRGKLGIRMETDGGLLMLRSDASAPVSVDGAGIVWRLSLSAGDAVHFSLTWTADTPAVLPPVGEWTRACIDRTLAHWEAWSAKTRFEGEGKELVIRSAITVRLLAYAPSGAIVAAPTTSLPETLGGDGNWDYRYCWLRDAAFTVRALLELGHPDEASGFAGWLLHATRLTQPKLMVLYDVFGRAPVAERPLSNLAGYAGSRPVRVGNGADGQVQLDSYGEVIDAVWRITRAGIPLDRETCDVLEGLGRYVCAHWTRPDAGIWEPRGAPRRHTHSIALGWTALDRLIDLQRRGEMRGRYGALFASTRDAIADVLRREAYSEALGSYTACLGGSTLDATALLLGWYGFDPPSSPRMRSTFDRIMASLSPRPGLLYRYRGPGDDEGAFGVCSFWIAEHLARGGGTLADARDAFRATATYANDVGLMAEEIDPASGRALGNFPQTFTHVGLLNAALSLAERERKERAE